MSRIHEALKRAEQERSMTQGGTLEVPLPPEVMPESATMHGVAPAGPASFSFEALLQRCPRMQWTPEARTMLFFNPDEKFVGKEEFRTLRSRLYQMREKRPLKKVLITSPLPKEGKTFVAANLAQVMVQQHGRRALLIDADLRGPSLHYELGAPVSPGLTEYLQGECDEFAALQQGPMDNLFFVPGGKMVTNPAELVVNSKLKLLLNRLEPLFDWIFIDSPPAVPVADASLLGNLCNGVLMVVRSSETPSDAARRARHEFAPEQLLGVVLNGTEAESNDYYQRYYYTYEAKAISGKS